MCRFFLEILSSRINLSNSSSSSTSIYKKSFGGKVSALFLLLDDHFGINCSCFLDAASWCAWKKIVAAQGEAHSGSRWLKLAGNIFTSVCVLCDFTNLSNQKFSFSVSGKKKCLIFKICHTHSVNIFLAYITMRKNLPKTLDQLTFSRFLPPKRRKTLHSY